MKKAFKLIIPLYLGAVLEWYDFSIFVFLAPILSKVFFPASTNFVSMLMTYAVFAIGFLARPLGGMVFGCYADRYGRKKSMLLSMMTLTFATVSIGLLPTYATLGVAAPLLLIVLRLLQGFCIGGESTGAAIYIIEMYHCKHRGVLTSLMWSASGVGMLLGSALSTFLFYKWTHEQLGSFYWRVPFFLSVATSVVAIYFRKKIPETLLFSQLEKIKKQAEETLFKTLNKNKATILRIVFLYGLSSAITYLLFVVMPVYMSQYNSIDLKTASLITSVSLMVTTLLVPVSGILSDKYGRKCCLYVGSMGFLFLSVPLYWYMNAEKTVASLIVADVFFVIFAVLYQGALTAAVQENTSTNNRFTLTSTGYNISYGIFGGAAPLVISWLSHVSTSRLIPGIYLSFFAFLALMTVCTMKETYQNPLQ